MAFRVPFEVVRSQQHGRKCITDIWKGRGHVAEQEHIRGDSSVRIVEHRVKQTLKALQLHRAHSEVHQDRLNSIQQSRSGAIVGSKKGQMDSHAFWTERVCPFK